MGTQAAIILIIQRISKQPQALHGAAVVWTQTDKNQPGQRCTAVQQSRGLQIARPAEPPAALVATQLQSAQGVAPAMGETQYCRKRQNCREGKVPSGCN
ncbi:MAG: hypothetical protein Hals2KO_24070 [Halioglobus sp.]